MPDLFRPNSVHSNTSQCYGVNLFVSSSRETLLLDHVILRSYGSLVVSGLRMCGHRSNRETLFSKSECMVLFSLLDMYSHCLKSC